MDFKEMYAQKKMTAEQAAALVKSGDWVDYGWCVNTPVAVDAALAKRLPELENVNFRGGNLMWVPEIFQIDDPAAHMTWNSARPSHRAFRSTPPSGILSFPAITAKAPTRWMSPSFR